jgi:hypothetical protein
MEGILNQPKEENLNDSRASDLSTEQLEKILAERMVKERKVEFENKEAEIVSERRGILKDLGEDISLGEPQTGVTGRAGEWIGIYRGGQYLGDVVSDSHLTRMSKEEFQDKVWDLLNKTESKYDFKIKIGDGVNDVMRSTGVVYNSDRTLILKDEGGGLLDIDLYNNGENVGADIERVDDTSLLLRIKEPSGKIIEYTIRGGVFLADSRRVLR